MADAGRPRRFGLITAVYNVARYLPDFIASIEAQTFSLDDVVVVAVDDGSTDDSLELLLDVGRPPARSGPGDLQRERRPGLGPQRRARRHRLRVGELSRSRTT